MSSKTTSPDQPLASTAAATSDHNYVVVARRYRPKSFGDLVGQKQLTQALTNAITTQRVGHAYLFTGARGVGKTSTARIFAKALNAPNGPTPDPDLDCDICRAIDAGEDVDVIEIDGASNRGIDEIRQLRSNANIRPSRARFKIYIIDEVHMLTTAAFNALLKTLEEPPSHVKFILCTTDPQKIPITVLSRCQRYDFAPVDVASIVNRLQHIVDHEGRQAEPEALQLLARRAEGSLRDSQSLLEQLLAYCGDTIRAQDVHQMLGTAESGRLADIAEHVIQRDAAGALGAVDEAVSQGVDCGQLAEQLLGYFRDMTAATVGCPADLMRHTSGQHYDHLKEAGTRLGLETTMATFEILDQAVIRMRQTLQPRTLLEIALVRICHLEDLDQLSTLIDRLQRGEMLPAGPMTPPRQATPSASQARSTASARPASDEEKNTADHGSVTSSAVASSIPERPLTAEWAEEVWKQVLAELGDMTADFAGFYDHLAISAPNSLVVHFREEYTLQKESCDSPSRKAQLEQAMADKLGRRVRIDLAVIPQARAAPAQPVTSTLQRMRATENHPLVRQAMELFDAEVIRVDPQRSASADGRGA